MEVLQDADVLLLQEVNLSGVEEISQRLRYNYVYYPAAFHRRLKIEFGNAILSKWPMSDKAKIVLPNWLSGWLETRNAAKATITIGHTDIQVYSTHLDVVWMMPVWTQTQGDFLTDMLGAERRFAIIGGDFNTWTKSSIRALETGFEQYGLVRLTKGTGYTFASSGLKLTLDHIFGENNLDFRSGVYR
ncbi:MAG: endonuclease/exonuclease/phosphatase family protein, partial [Anaerolineales bacterium]